MCSRSPYFLYLSDRCGPSELGGSVFDPSSYNCSATCELTNGVPSTPIGIFHNEIVNDLLPTLHGKARFKNISLDYISFRSSKFPM